VLATGIAPQATVILPGAVIAGNAAGLIVITCVKRELILLQTSVAVHVLV
jgi:hypothetical protein